MRSPNDTLAPTSLTLALCACAALAACAPGNKAADTSSVVPDRAGTVASKDAPEAAQADLPDAPDPNLETGGGDCGRKGASGVIEGAFAERDSSGKFTVPAPGGPGVMTMTFGVEQIQVKVAMRPKPSRMHSSINPKNETITHTWYGKRGFSYPYELTQRTLAAEEDYPIKWYAEWSWTPSGDCTEPNQTHAQATPLELGEPAEGFLRTGYHDGYHFKEMLDVWKVEVPEGGVLTARLKSSPPDLTPSISIHDAAERNVSFNPTPTSAATKALPAGTYYVHVGVFMMPRTPVQRKGEGGSFDSIDLPHLTTPYELVVERADPPADAP
jgi:hypothetical protein